MFLEILQTLIKVLFVFSILIIAFGLAFYILLSKVKLRGFVKLSEFSILHLILDWTTECESPIFSNDSYVAI